MLMPASHFDFNYQYFNKMEKIGSIKPKETLNILKLAIYSFVVIVYKS